jgi:putative ABC transport system permease protein
MLVVLTGLLLQSLVRLEHQDPGIQIDNLLTFRLSISQAAYSDRNIPMSLFLPYLERLRALPGIKAAAIVNLLPLENSGMGSSVVIPGHDGLQETPELRLVSSDYHRTLGIPMQQGRDFNDSDVLGSTPVAIINDVMAGRCFGGQSPLGAHVRFPNGLDFTIIGVAKANKQYNMGVEAQSEINLAILQMAPKTTLYSALKKQVAVVVRSDGKQESLSSVFTKELHALDSSSPIFDVRPMREILETSLEVARIGPMLLGATSLLAILLASIGIYGITNFQVVQRTKEIGIRMALGANRNNILRMVLIRLVFLSLLGIGWGYAAALVCGAIFRTMLFQVAPWSPYVMVASIVIILPILILAAILPARHASKIDPAIVLRG